MEFIISIILLAFYFIFIAPIKKIIEIISDKSENKKFIENEAIIMKRNEVHSFGFGDVRKYIKAAHPEKFEEDARQFIKHYRNQLEKRINDKDIKVYSTKRGKIKKVYLGSFDYMCVRFDYNQRHGFDEDYDFSISFNHIHKYLKYNDFDFMAALNDYGFVVERGAYEEFVNSYNHQVDDYHYSVYAYVEV